MEPMLNAGNMCSPHFAADMVAGLTGLPFFTIFIYLWGP